MTGPIRLWNDEFQKIQSLEGQTVVSPYGEITFIPSDDITKTMQRDLTVLESKKPAIYLRAAKVGKAMPEITCEVFERAGAAGPPLDPNAPPANPNDRPANERAGAAGPPLDPNAPPANPNDRPANTDRLVDKRRESETIREVLIRSWENNESLSSDIETDLKKLKKYFEESSIKNDFRKFHYALDDYSLKYTEETRLRLVVQKEILLSYIRILKEKNKDLVIIADKIASFIAIFGDNHPTSNDLRKYYKEIFDIYASYRDDFKILKIRYDTFSFWGKTQKFVTAPFSSWWDNDENGSKISAVVSTALTYTLMGCYELAKYASGYSIPDSFWQMGKTIVVALLPGIASGTAGYVTDKICRRVFKDQYPDLLAKRGKGGTFTSPGPVSQEILVKFEADHLASGYFQEADRLDAQRFTLSLTTLKQAKALVDTTLKTHESKDYLLFQTRAKPISDKDQTAILRLINNSLIGPIRNREIQRYIPGNPNPEIRIQIWQRHELFSEDEQQQNYPELRFILTVLEHYADQLEANKDQTEALREAGANLMGKETQNQTKTELQHYTKEEITQHLLSLANNIRTSFIGDSYFSLQNEEDKYFLETILLKKTFNPIFYSKDNFIAAISSLYTQHNLLFSDKVKKAFESLYIASIQRR